MKKNDLTLAKRIIKTQTMKNKITVLYQFNEKYVPFAGVSITSLLENNRDMEAIIIYLLGEQISVESQEKLKNQINKYGRECVFIDAANTIQKMKALGLNQYRNSYAANIKLFVNEFIPKQIERILYLDCDTIINGSLKSLFELDMKNKPIAMVLDTMCANHKLAIGFSEKDLYFNTGVILFDLWKWKQVGCEERIVNHIKNIRAHYLAPDQDLMNIVLHNEILVLKPTYNFQPMHMVYDYRQYMKFFGQKPYYSEATIKNAKEKTKIFHTFRYLGEFPWHLNNMHPAKKIFDRYLYISLWNDYKKKTTDKNDIVFIIERILYRMLPKSLFLPLFKFSYELFMWKSNNDSLKSKNNIRM